LKHQRFQQQWPLQNIHDVKYCSSSCARNKALIPYKLLVHPVVGVFVPSGVIDCMAYCDGKEKNAKIAAL
jgi:hypothetical protein